MGATAKLMAMLGLDGSQFTAGIKGAERSALGFGEKLKGIHTMMKSVFAFRALTAFTNAAKDIRELQERIPGITLVNDDQLNRIDRVADGIEVVKAALLSLPIQAIALAVWPLIEVSERFGKMYSGAGTDSDPSGWAARMVRQNKQRAIGKPVTEEQAEAARAKLQDDLMKRLSAETQYGALVQQQVFDKQELNKLNQKSQRALELQIAIAARELEILKMRDTAETRAIALAEKRAKFKKDAAKAAWDEHLADLDKKTQDMADQISAEAAFDKAAAKEQNALTEGSISKAQRIQDNARSIKKLLGAPSGYESMGAQIGNGNAFKISSGIQVKGVDEIIAMMRRIEGE